MEQFITKIVITFVVGIFGFFILHRTWTSEVDFFGWFKKQAEKLIPIKQQAVPTDERVVLITDKAPLFEDKVNVYWGSNLSIKDVETVGSRQIVRPLKGLDIALEKGQIKISARVLSSDGKTACQITDNECKINPNAVFTKNFDKNGLEVIDNYGLAVLQVDLLDKQTLKVAGLFELEGMAVCITDKMGPFRVPWSKVNEHFEEIAEMLKRQELMFQYPADKHFGERADRQQIKPPGRDERLSTKNIAAKRKKLSALSNVDLKKRLHEQVAAIQQSISQALKDATPELNNASEGLKELDEHITIEELQWVQRSRAGIQQYEDQFKPDIVALYDEIAFRLGTRAKEMPGRMLFENPMSAYFLSEELNELASVTETLE